MAKEVKIKITGETSKYEKSMRDVHLHTKKMTRSVGQSWTSMAKKIGGALGMITAGYGVKALTSELLSSASDLEEAANKFGVVFKGQVQQAESWATIFVDAYAMSRREAMQYLASIQDLLVPMGMQAGAAGQLSNEIVKLSADLGSFNNLGTAQVMGDIQSALVGNYETMKKYGVVLSATVVQEKALAMGLANTKDQLTAGLKAQAAYKLMVEGSQAAIGDMARTSGGYANQIKQLKANFENLSAAMGSELLPIATDVVKQINLWVRANENLLKQKVSLYVAELTKSLKGIVAIYDSLPEGVAKAAGLGIVGKMIFGGPAAPVIAGMSLADTYLKKIKTSLAELLGVYLGSVPIGEFMQKHFGKTEMDKIFGGGRPSGHGAGGAFAMPEITPPGGGGGAGGGEPEPWEHAKSIAEQVVNSWNEVISDSETLGLSYFFRRDQALLEEARQQELERLRVFGEQRIELNQWEHDAAIYMMQHRQAEELRIEEQTRRMRIQGQQQLVDNVIKTGKLIMGVSGKQNKALFRAVQAVSAGKAAIYAYQSAAKAMAEVPWPLNVAVAASNLAFGMAQVANIMAQSPGGGTAVSGVPAVSTSTAPVYTPYPGGAMAGTEARATTNIYIQGDFIGEETWIDYLIEKLNQAGEARDVYIYASHARTAEELGY